MGTWAGPLATAALHLLGSYWGSAGSPRVHCVVECPSSSVNSELIEVLREQLRRCGPQNLTLPACPACICSPERPQAGLGVFTLIGVAAGSAALGSFVGARARPPPVSFLGARPRPPAAERALAPAPEVHAPSPPRAIAGVVTTPKALRALTQ